MKPSVRYCANAGNRQGDFGQTRGPARTGGEQGGDGRKRRPRRPLPLRSRTVKGWQQPAIVGSVGHSAPADMIAARAPGMRAVSPSADELVDQDFVDLVLPQYQRANFDPSVLQPRHDAILPESFDSVRIAQDRVPLYFETIATVRAERSRPLSRQARDTVRGLSERSCRR